MLALLAGQYTLTLAMKNGFDVIKDNPTCIFWQVGIQYLAIRLKILEPQRVLLWQSCLLLSN